MLFVETRFQQVLQDIERKINRMDDPEKMRALLGEWAGCERLGGLRAILDWIEVERAADERP